MSTLITPPHATLTTPIRLNAHPTTDSGVITWTHFSRGWPFVTSHWWIPLTKRWLQNYTDQLSNNYVVNVIEENWFGFVDSLYKTMTSKTMNEIWNMHFKKYDLEFFLGIWNNIREIYSIIQQGQKQLLPFCTRDCQSQLHNNKYFDTI